jgi:DNA-binding CsgD family transcriptional regulator
MSEAEVVSSLIGDIYDAALDPNLWVPVLEKTAGFVRGPASALVAHDPSSQSGGFYYSWGDDPRYSQLYFEKYVKLNPTLAHMAIMRAGEVHSISTVLPFDEFRQTRLYTEWAKPQGYGDATLAVLEKSSMTTVHVTVTHFDRDSPVGDEFRHRMGLLLPHLRRAVAIARIVELHKIEAAMLADAVDTISAGVALVADEGRIVRVNGAARVMLEARDLVREDHGILSASSPEAREALRDAIAGAGSGEIAARGRRAAVALLSRDGERYVAHVLPLTAGARREARLRYAATAAVFIHRAAPDGLTPVEAISQHFQLTPAELRVLVAIVEVGGVPEVASVLGISETTVKTHLRHLFEKTDTHRQADLVKLVANYSAPLIT